MAGPRWPSTVAGLLAEVAREHGMTVVCATHEPLVMARANRRLEL